MSKPWDGMAEAIERKIMQRVDAIHANCSFKMLKSIVEGSALTGAPGQPKDTGALKSNWLASSGFKGPLKYIAGTNMKYAEAIEEGIQQPYTTQSGTHVTPRPMTLRSEVGGFHSVKMTKDNFRQIVDAAIREEVRD